MADELIGRTLGRYEITALVGHGGMATVYRATHPGLRQTVAVKVLHAHLANDPNLLVRFEREAQAVAALRHPNIVRVIDFDCIDGQYFMVMEYVAGATLAARLGEIAAQHRRMSPAEVLRLFEPLCAGVDYAHGEGMIHRDVKPANVLLTARGEPVLSDYGIARIVGRTQHTATGTVMGSAHYMSPEQAQGLAADGRSDLYALGVILFEALAGRVPYEADSLPTVLLKHVTAPVPAVCPLNPALPPPVDDLMRRALAKDPDERYQTGADLSAALRESLAPLLAEGERGSTRPAAVAPAAAPAAPAQGPTRVEEPPPSAPPPAPTVITPRRSAEASKAEPRPSAPQPTPATEAPVPTPVPDTPPGVNAPRRPDAVARKAITKDADGRDQSAAEMGADILERRAQRVPGARTPAPPPPVRRQARTAEDLVAPSQAPIKEPVAPSPAPVQAPIKEPVAPSPAPVQAPIKEPVAPLAPAAEEQVEQPSPVRVPPEAAEQPADVPSPVLDEARPKAGASRRRRLWIAVLAGIAAHDRPRRSGAGEPRTGLPAGSQQAALRGATLTLRRRPHPQPAHRARPSAGSVAGGEDKERPIPEAGKALVQATGFSPGARAVRARGRGDPGGPGAG